MGEEKQYPVSEEVHGAMIARFDPDPFKQQPGIYTSWDIQESGGVDRLAKGLRQPKLSSDDIIDHDVLVEHVMCHGVELAHPETGELVAAVRTVLYLTDGDTVAFVSTGVFQSLSLLARVYGPPPWNGGRKVRLFRQKTRKGFRTILMEPRE